MRILAINGGNTGSSWTIATSILEEAYKQGNEVSICVPKAPAVSEHIDYFSIVKGSTKTFSWFVAKLFGNDGFLNYSATRRLLRHIKKFKPDIVH